MIIKSKHAATLIKDAVVLDLGDLSRQAEQLRQAAQAKADALLHDARTEAARLTASAEQIGLDQGRAAGHKQGYEEGLAQGKAEALAQASKELKRVSQLWETAARDVEAQRQAMARDGRQAVLELALRMAEKLVHRVVEVDETVIIDQVANALSHVLRPLDVTVRINAADRAILENGMPELLADFAQFKHVRLVDDAVIGPGGCVVTYGQGRVDATVETQLNRIIAMMLPGGTAVADEAERTETLATDDQRANEDQSHDDDDANDA